MDFTKRIKLIWSVAKKHFFLFGVAEICILILYAASLILPLNLKRLTDNVLIEGNHALLGNVVLIYAILFFVTSITNILYGYIWQTLSNRYILNLKTTLYQKIIYAKASFLTGMNSGDCMSRIDGDTEQFLHAIQRNLFHFVNSVILCAVIIILVAQMNFTIAVMLVVAALLPVVITRLYSILMEKYAKKCREIEGKLVGKLFELLKGLREIKLLSAHGWATRQLSADFGETMTFKNRMVEVDFALQKCVYLINLMTSVVIYGYATYLIVNHLLSVGAFLAMIEYIALLHKKFNWILRICLEWHARKVSIDRVSEILSLESETDEGKEIHKIDCIAVNNVSLRYSEKEILKNLSFTIHKGEKIAIVGESGCGKTTLVGLLTGLYQPYSGVVFVDGVSLNRIKPSSLRSNMAVVSQDIALFEGSIKSNLTLFEKNLDADLQRVIQAVGLTEKINEMDNGMETSIDNRTKNLSSGQKQRLMIARALIKNTDFLIFDEATSALDKRAQREIIHTIMLENIGTVILISHHASHVEYCDRIIVLNQRGIEKIGTHDDLLMSSPTYHSLFIRKPVRKKVKISDDEK